MISFSADFTLRVGGVDEEKGVAAGEPPCADRDPANDERDEDQ